MHWRRPQAADFGPKTALKIVDRIRDGIKRGRVKSADDTRKALKDAIVELLTQGVARGPAGSPSSSVASRSSELVLSGTKPAVVLVVGVNGAGKVRQLGPRGHQTSPR